MEKKQKKDQGEDITFHKYESDRTPKEKWELEKQKLSGMSWKEKLQYIWTYYKPVLAAAAGLILVIVFICQVVENSKYETILGIGVIGANMPEDTETVQEELQQQFGTGSKYDKVSLDTSFMMQDVENADYSMVMKFTTVVAAQDLDILITNEAVYDHYSEQGMFTDLSAIFTPEECDKYGIEKGSDRLDITDTLWLAENQWVSYEPVYLTVISNTNHQDKIKEFIRAVEEEE